MLSILSRQLPRFFFCLFFFATFSIQAQTLLTGVVRDSVMHNPLPYVQVVVEGTHNGVLTDLDGRFELKTNMPLPVRLQFHVPGFTTKFVQVANTTAPIDVIMQEGAVMAGEVVVTGSRLSERIIQSPVAIDKLDLLAIKESAASNFFDAMENIKGVQMTTLSLGFKVPNTRGFTNTTNARFLQMIDGADSQAPGLGVSIANTVGPTDLDVLSVEITPGASSSLYGMNALNGIANVMTKNPFYYEGLSVYQKTGVNHVRSAYHEEALFTETGVRFADVLTSKLAYKFNVGFTRGTDWVAGNQRDLNPDVNAPTGLTGSLNPGLDPVNSYGNESSNRRVISLADGKRYEVRRTGYWEQDLVTNDYNVDNLKADVGLFYRPTEKSEFNYVYRLGKSDAIYQRGNRIRLDDYRIQQHKVEARGLRWSGRVYYTIEHTDKSYNLRPMGENLDKSFKSNAKWFADYTAAFNQQYGLGVASADAHQIARSSADAGRLEPGTEAFNSKLLELAGINNWDVGAQLVMDHRFAHGEFQYDFTNLITWADILVGVDYRNFFIKPEGNSFINPDPDRPDAIMNYDKTGGFVQASRKFLKDRWKWVASVRVDKNKYFDAKVNPRVATVFELNKSNYIRASYQNGYRFPTLFEAFSTVNNGGVIRFGGLRILTNELGLFENSYIRSSVDEFQKAVLRDVNQGASEEQAIQANSHLLEVNKYSYLEPEEINSWDVGIKSSLFKGKLYVEADVYYTRFTNFIDQIEISVPNKGKIGDLVNGVDSTIYQMADNADQTRYRMWTNSGSDYHNAGGALSASWNFVKSFYLNTNVSVNRLYKIADRDKYLETPFNTPPYIVNVGVSNREIRRNLGFTVTGRWQDSFEWKSPLANGNIPSYFNLDAQITLKVPVLLSVWKFGATNLLNDYYTQYEGGPSVGGFYYFTWTFEGVSKRSR